MGPRSTARWWTSEQLPLLRVAAHHLRKDPITGLYHRHQSVRQPPPSASRPSDLCLWTPLVPRAMRLICLRSVSPVATAVIATVAIQLGLLVGAANCGEVEAHRRVDRHLGLGGRVHRCLRRLRLGRQHEATPALRRSPLRIRVYRCEAVPTRATARWWPPSPSATNSSCTNT